MKKIVTIIVNFFVVLFIFLVIIYVSLYIKNKNNDVSTNNPSIIDYQVKIHLNGATSVEKEKITCIVTDGKCLITLPKAYRSNGNILGYHTSSNSHIALYHEEEEINLEKDLDLYIISNKKNTLNIDNRNIDYISSFENYCYMYNKDKSCDVKIPYFNKIGYEVKGYSAYENSLSGYLYPNTLYSLTKDITIYPIYNNSIRAKVINVSNNYMIGNMVFDIESGCDESIYSNYLKYFERINQKAKYLSIGSKITFLTDDTFNTIWGNKYVGMNYGPLNLRLFDVRCSSTLDNNYYATIVHEMSHTWDFYYTNFFDKNITQENDIINLYNKYKNEKNRPFRDYSYTDIYEFFADMVRYYYLKYTDPINDYSNLDYPSDIKKTLEKYICIANNNYDKRKCQ